MQTNELNMWVFWACVAIGFIVYAGIIWSLIAYRKSRQGNDQAFHKHTVVEIAWTVIPLIIIVAMILPAARLLTRIYGADDGGSSDGGNGMILNPSRIESQIVKIEDLHFSIDHKVT